MALLKRLAKNDLTLFIIKLLVLLISFFLVLCVLKVCGLSDAAAIGVPIIITVTIFLSQFFIRLLQLKTNVPPSFLGLIINTRAIKSFLCGVALIFSVGLLTFSVELLLGWIKFERIIWQLSEVELLQGGLSSILLVICLQLTAGWWEELLFRGYLIQSPTTNLGFLISAGISSLLFGILHHLVPPKIPLEVIPIYSVAGLLFAYCYRKKGLWFTIGIHFAWNTVPSLVFGLASQGMISIIKINHNFPKWTTLSGFTIDPWQLLFLFVLGVISVWKKSSYSIQSNWEV